MTYTESKSLGVQLGPFVPVEDYDTVSAAIWRRFPDTSTDQPEHSRAATVGWTGVGYRARATGEHLAAFRGLFDTEPAASHECRYEQDHHYFGFVTNAAAAADSLVYAAHAVALGLAQTDLSEGLLKRDRISMITAIQSVGELRNLGNSLYAAFARDDARILFEMRDMLMHRGRPPRNHFVGGEFDGRATLARNPKAIPSNWVNNFVFDATSCNAWATWLENLIRSSIAHLLTALE